MRSTSPLRYFQKLILASAAVFLTATPALAAVQLDSGSQLSLDKPFDSAQKVSNIYQDVAVYGKLEGDIPIDIYSFTPGSDGEQTISLLVRAQEQKDAQPLLILEDPTNATVEQPIGIPTPGDEYHTALVTQVSKTYNETLLFTQYAVVSEQHIKLQKDKTYYLVVIDQSRATKHYALKFGDGKAWGGKDLFTHFGTWIRVKSDAYAGSGPFAFNPIALGLLLFVLGLMVMVGTWIISATFLLMAGRSKAAAYLLIKMQSFSRIIYWVALWFTAIGGYIYFHKVGWFGLPFILGLIFIPLLLILLYETLLISPKLMQVEVSKKEAALPASLSKPLYVTFVLGLLSLGSFITLLSMYFTPGK